MRRHWRRRCFAGLLHLCSRQQLNPGSLPLRLHCVPSLSLCTRVHSPDAGARQREEGVRVGVHAAYAAAVAATLVLHLQRRWTAVCVLRASLTLHRPPTAAKPRTFCPQATKLCWLACGALTLIDKLLPFQNAGGGTRAGGAAAAWRLVPAASGGAATSSQVRALLAAAASPRISSYAVQKHPFLPTCACCRLIAAIPAALSRPAALAPRRRCRPACAASAAPSVDVESARKLLDGAVTVIDLRPTGWYEESRISKPPRKSVNVPFAAGGDTAGFVAEVARAAPSAAARLIVVSCLWVAGVVQACDGSAACPAWPSAACSPCDMWSQRSALSRRTARHPTTHPSADVRRRRRRLGGGGGRAGRGGLQQRAGAASRASPPGPSAAAGALPAVGGG